MDDQSNGIITKTSFCEGVRAIVEEGSMSWLDATLHFCKQNDIEPETVPSLIDRQLKEALEADGLALNLLKRDSEKIV